MGSERMFDTISLDEWEMAVEAHLDVVEMHEQAKADALAEYRQEAEAESASRYCWGFPDEELCF